MVISIFLFDPWGQFQGQNIGQKVITAKFTKITKMMPNLNTWLFPLFKDALLFQIGPLVQKIWGFEVGRPPLFSLNFQKINPPYLGNQSSNWRKILDLRFGGQNQHVSQISLNSERVGFSPLGDLTWNDPQAIHNINLKVYEHFMKDCYFLFVILTVIMLNSVTTARANKLAQGFLVITRQPL